jgi:hypothetical protein
MKISFKNKKLYKWIIFVFLFLCFCFVSYVVYYLCSVKDIIGTCEFYRLLAMLRGLYLPTCD